MNDEHPEIDWSLTTWEGSRRAQLQQWQKLSVRQCLEMAAAMGDLAERFSEMRSQGQFSINQQQSVNLQANKKPVLR
jgi:hypothetical protein